MARSHCNLAPRCTWPAPARRAQGNAGAPPRARRTRDSQERGQAPISVPFRRSEAVLAGVVGHRSRRVEHDVHVERRQRRLRRLTRARAAAPAAAPVAAPVAAPGRVSPDAERAADVLRAAVAAPRAHAPCSARMPLRGGPVPAGDEDEERQRDIPPDMQHAGTEARDNRHVHAPPRDMISAPALYCPRERCLQRGYRKCAGNAPPSLDHGRPPPPTPPFDWHLVSAWISSATDLPAGCSPGCSRGSRRGSRGKRRTRPCSRRKLRRLLLALRGAAGGVAAAALPGAAQDRAVGDEPAALRTAAGPSGAARRSREIDEHLAAARCGEHRDDGPGEPRAPHKRSSVHGRAS